jgi:RND family efflux transporter MFP subunit
MKEFEPTEAAPPDVVPPMPPAWRRTIPKVVATIGSVIVGVLGAGGLIAAGSAAEKTTPPERVDLVEAMTLDAGRAQAVVKATGTVLADQQVVLSPEVAGRLTWVADGLKPGQRFARGETIARVDSRDYEAAVAAEQSRLRQAELELSLEENRGSVAAKEWELLGSDAGGDGTLARREPHLEVARANVEAARANLKRAELNLSRTSIRAPFNAVVLSENVDVGQVVGSGSQVATLAGTDRVRVEASVPYDRLASLAIPGVGGITDAEASTATVRQPLGDGRAIVREGRVIGMGGQLDPQTRTATVLVSVDAPYDPPDGGLPLLVGAFVDVSLGGRAVDEALVVPRTAVYDGDTVWVVGDDEKLERRTVQTGWSMGDRLQVLSGLEAGDQVVTTPLSAPIAGTRVRLLGEEG